MALAGGTRVGPYEVLDLLGAGGMGEVYRARDSRLGRVVALKVLCGDARGAPDDAAPDSFLREAQAASALNHPSIVTIYDVGPGYIAMEFVAGESLARLIRDQRLELREAIAYAQQIAGAMAKAHAAGIIHRDLKPANVMVTPDGLVKILDFGLAQRTAATLGDETLSAREGAILGTAAYMSPEQAQGKVTDARSDIFSFGIMLYEMLTGCRPFPGSTALVVITAILRDEPAPPRRFQPAIPADWENAILRCLRKDPNRRFQHMDEVRAALQETTQQPPPSIAVLPFANLSADKENDYFSDGLAEEILNGLTPLTGLRVVARTSAFAFRGREAALQEIGQKLQVQTLLQGSVRRAGNRIRVTAQLVRVADESQLWSERYDRELTDVFAIQDEIAQAIVERLKVKLDREPGSTLVKRYTENQEAHSSYLKGVFHLNRHVDLSQARADLERAVSIEPLHAPAWVRLSEYYCARCFRGDVAGRDSLPQALDAAEKAVAADGELAEAHAALALAMGFSEYRWPECMAHFRRALQLNPRSSQSLFWYRCAQRATGRLEDCVASLRLALASDPLSPLHLACLADDYNAMGRYQDAAFHARQALEVLPFFWPALTHLGDALVYLGQAEEGLALLERAREGTGGDGHVTGYLGSAYVRAGKPAQAEQLLMELLSRSRERYVAPTSLAMIAAALARTGEAFQWLETALQERDVWFCYLPIDPHFDAIRADPRFTAILRKAGLPATS